MDALAWSFERRWFTGRERGVNNLFVPSLFNREPTFFFSSQALTSEYFLASSNWTFAVSFSNCYLRFPWWRFFKCCCLSPPSSPVTKHGGNQLSCSVSSQGTCRYSVRWLLNGQHYPGTEGGQDWTNSWNCICTVTFSPPAPGQEPNREDLFTCEVKGGSGRDSKLFNLSRQLEGETLINKANLSHPVMMLKFCLFPFSFFPFCPGSHAATPKPTTSTVTENGPNTGGNPGTTLPGGNPTIGSPLCLFLRASSWNSQLQATPISSSSSYGPVQQNQAQTWAPSEVKARPLRSVSRGSQWVSNRPPTLALPPTF